MGTDEIGRDTLARIIDEAQVSLQVGAVAISIAFFLGTLIGASVGFMKRVDLVLDALCRRHVRVPGHRARDPIAVSFLGPTGRTR